MHTAQTRWHVQRLEEIFDKLGQKAKRKMCKAMEGIVEEGKEMMPDAVDAAVIDARRSSAAQRVEHYEIAAYGCARTYARVLGDKQAAQLLQQTLDEEGETDKKLTQLAESSINIEAANPAN